MLKININNYKTYILKFVIILDAKINFFTYEWILVYIELKTN